MIEKRRWPRIACEWEAVFSAISGRSTPGLSASTTIDVSQGGVRFRCSAFIPVGERLRFTLRPPKSVPVEAILSPVWVREIPNLNVFEVGGSFEDLSQDGRETLRQWADTPQALLVTRVPEAESSF